MNNYEITFITRENLGEKPFKDLLDNLSGSILSVSSIGERQFAYPIKKETRGVYTTVLFNLDPEKLNDLNRKLTLNEDILRFLITAKKASAMKALEEAAAKANEIVIPEEIAAPVEITDPVKIDEPKEIEAPVEIETPIVEIKEKPPVPSEVKEKAVKKTVKKVPARNVSSIADVGGEKTDEAKATAKPAENKTSEEVAEIEKETESEEDRLKELDKKLDELLKD